MSFIVRTLAASSMKRLAYFFEKQSLPIRIAIILAMLGCVGMGDYITGYEISFLIFYLVPIALSRWFIGSRFSVLTALLSLIVWIAADRLSGGPPVAPFILAWNASVSLGFFVVVIGLVGYLRTNFDELETRVAQRTSDLTSEIAERRRLEKEILGISEREQFRIGHDLHDTVCQQLTGTALAAEVLEEKVAKNKNLTTSDLREIVRLIQEANDLTRRLARGLSPVEITPDGLMDALHNLAASTTRYYQISCELNYEDPLLVPDVESAMHIYRIAQEAVTNSVKHARASKIAIGINHQGDFVLLTIQDDGVGYDSSTASTGMGTQIMVYRASMIGATLEIRCNTPHGTIVKCNLPKSLLHIHDRLKKMGA